jgi:AcrR family transcriptional regulator
VSSTKPAAASKRERDPERTRAEILEVATREFADNGFDGGRVDEIAARTRTTKRMIYYYFESKENLYIEVLRNAYAKIRAAEQELDVEQSDARAAIRRLAELTFDHHESHADFIRLVSIENIARAEHMAKLPSFSELNSPAIAVIGKILERGYVDGSFTRRIEPLDLHMMISSFCVFRVANRYTFRTIFGLDLTDPATRSHYRTMLGDMVVGYLTSPADR